MKPCRNCDYVDDQLSLTDVLEHVSLIGIWIQHTDVEGYWGEIAGGRVVYESESEAQADVDRSGPYASVRTYSPKPGERFVLALRKADENANN